MAPFSSQVWPGTVFEPSYHRKSDLSRNITFSNGFCSKLTPRWGQDRPKIAPRRVQDRLGSLFLPLRFSLRFLIVLGSVLVPFWPPKGVLLNCAGLRVLAPGGVQDGLGIVLVRFFFRLAVRVRFFGPLGLLLGSFWGAPGVVFGFSGRQFGAFNFSLVFSFFLFSAVFSPRCTCDSNPGPVDCAMRDEIRRVPLAGALSRVG